MRIRFALGAVAVAALTFAAPAAAKTFEVTRTADTAPNGCGQSGCTLREAVIAANGRNGKDKIVLRSGKSYKLQIAGADEEEAATGDLDLTGPTRVTASRRRPARIDAQLLDRVFDATAAASFSRLAMRRGTTQALAGEEEGGAIRSAEGRLQVVGCKFGGIVAPPLGLGAANAAVQKLEGAPGDIVLRQTTVRGTDGVAVTTRGDGAIEIQRSRLLDNFYGAARSFGSGGIALTGSAVIRGERGAVVDFEGGGIRLLRSRVNQSEQGALTDFDAGGIAVSRSRITGNDDDALADFGDGGITVKRARIANNGQSVVDFDAGGVVVSASRITDSDSQGVSDFGAGGVRLSNSLVADSGSQGVQDFDAGAVDVVNSRVARSGSQGVQNFGTGALNVRRSRVNGSELDAVAQFDAGALRISRSTVSGGRGGGVFVDGAALVSSIVGSTISGNRTPGDGGGIANEATLVVRNSTIASNRADGNGGGISNTGTLRLNNVTIARNVADAENDTNGAGGGIRNGLLLASVDVGNTLIALNDQRGGDADDCSGGFDSAGGNLRTDGTDCGGFDGPGDRVRANPRLGSLKRNGGPTKTIALKPGSPAIGGARKGSAENRDQRGRKRDKRPDVGAFER